MGIVELYQNILGTWPQSGLELIKNLKNIKYTKFDFHKNVTQLQILTEFQKIKDVCETHNLASPKKTSMSFKECFD